jgi:hypothetical protein
LGCGGVVKSWVEKGELGGVGKLLCSVSENPQFPFTAL